MRMRADTHISLPPLPQGHTAKSVLKKAKNRLLVNLYVFLSLTLEIRLLYLMLQEVKSLSLERAHLPGILALQVSVLNRILQDKH